MNMTLKRLAIERIPEWRDESKSGKYEAEIKYENANGSVEMKLPPKVSEALLVCIADVITKFAAEAAEELKSNIVASVEQAKQPFIENDTARAVAE